MINTILFIAIIVLMLVLFALLVVIVLEYRAKKSYDHYIMESEESEEHNSTKADHEYADVSQENDRRSIPEPGRKEESRPEKPDIDTSGTVLPDNTETEADGDEKRLFRQYPAAQTPEPEESSGADEITKKEYGPFTHQRLVETMGLSPEEADEFVLELIHQLESAIVQLDESIEKGDVEEIEHITHGLKGAALNIGSGGVADILVDYNTEMKDGKSLEKAAAYQELLRHAVSDLKIEYSQVA